MSAVGTDRHAGMTDQDAVEAGPAGQATTPEAVPTGTASRPSELLSVRGLHVSFGSEPRAVHAVRGVDLDVRPGEIVALVGESGSGKSVSALALLRLLPSSARVRMESAFLGGQDLARVHDEELRRMRGALAGVIFQDPLSSLNPVHRIGDQIVEAIQLHRPVGRAEARRTAIERLEQVGIASAADRFGDYPHQFSGGMRQRVMIAMALATSPPLLIADEPTTALDVTVQAQILELITRLRGELGMGVLLITHDLGVVSRVADRVVVMYAGRIAETGPTDRILRAPSHPYTHGLLQSLPRLDLPQGGMPTPIAGSPPQPDELVAGCAFRPRCPRAVARCEEQPPLDGPGDGTAFACWRPLVDDADDGARRPAAPARPTAASNGGSAATAPVLLDAEGLKVSFHRRTVFRRGGVSVRAVDGVDLAIEPGTTLALVGESGSGKTTLGRAILRLIPVTEGTVRLDGEDLLALSGAELRDRRRRVQIVFQDPAASLNPRQRIKRILMEPLEIHGLGASGRERETRVNELLELVGLSDRFADRLPHQLSGGQRQRVCIARALAVEPDIVVLDEAVSALDVSIQAQILTLLERLRVELGVAYLFISHDLAVVRQIADTIAVMYLGRIVEQGPSEQVYAGPRHPYTAALLSAVPIPDTELERSRSRILLRGDPPSPSTEVEGCPFHTRCWLRHELGDPDVCVTTRPPLAATGPNGAHRAACHFSEEQDAHLPEGFFRFMGDARDAS